MHHGGVGLDFSEIRVYDIVHKPIEYGALRYNI